MEATIKKHDPYAALRYKEFVFFILARLFLTLATSIQFVVINWQIFDLTHSKLAIGMIGLTEAVPFTLTVLFAGYIVDIFERKKIILLSAFTFLICTACLVYISFHIQSVLHDFGVTPIYVVIFFTGIARSFLMPSAFALLSQLLDREHYTNGATWNSSVWQTGSVVGMAAGGLLTAWVGVNYAYVVDLILLFLSIFFFLLIPRKPKPVQVNREPIFQSIRTGIRFVFNNKIILTAISLDLFAVFFGGAVSIVVVFCEEILHKGPEYLGILRAAPGLGALLMGLVLAYRPPSKNSGRNLLIAVTGFGLCMILFGFSTNLYVALLALFMSGAFDCVSVVTRQTILQLLTPDEMRGRVSSVNSIFVGSSNEIGEFESGVTAEYMGLVPSIVFGGCMTLLVVMVTLKKAPELIRLNLQKLQKERA